MAVRDRATRATKPAAPAAPASGENTELDPALAEGQEPGDEPTGQEIDEIVEPAPVVVATAPKAEDRVQVVLKNGEHFGYGKQVFLRDVPTWTSRKVADVLRTKVVRSTLIKAGKAQAYSEPRFEFPGDGPRRR